MSKTNKFSGPGYLKLLSDNKFKDRIKKAYQLMESCNLCPRNCQVNRLKGEMGQCQTGKDLIISSYGPHHGEEAPLTGLRGSGTIFFSGCNLNCVFCQNYQISQQVAGRKISIPELAKIMLKLEGQGCHNINLVTPSHFAYHIIAAVYLAAKRGLKIPIVYNSSGYDSLTTLKLFDNIIDIYLPDFKYGSDGCGKKYARVKDYFSKASLAIKTMHKQVGLLQTDKKGIARRGLMIRHLLLPANLAESEKIFSYIAREIHPETYLNIMRQYYPSYQAHKYAELDTRLSSLEYQEALKKARDLGLKKIN